MTDAYFPISLPVAGMSCAACESHVDDVLKALPGVDNVSYNVSAHRVTLRYDPNQTSIKDLVRVVGEAGYLVMNVALTLHIRGMASAACARHVERALQALPGVEDAFVKLSPGIARVRYVSGAVTMADMSRAVQEAGYEVAQHCESAPL